MCVCVRACMCVFKENWSHYQFDTVITSRPRAVWRPDHYLQQLGPGLVLAVALSKHFHSAPFNETKVCHRPFSLSLSIYLSLYLLCCLVPSLALPCYPTLLFCVFLPRSSLLSFLLPLSALLSLTLPLPLSLALSLTHSLSVYITEREIEIKRNGGIHVLSECWFIFPSYWFLGFAHAVDLKSFRDGAWMTKGRKQQVVEKKRCRINTKPSIHFVYENNVHKLSWWTLATAVPILEARIKSFHCFKVKDVMSFSAVFWASQALPAVMPKCPYGSQKES